MENIKGKSAVVTGGVSGIGLEICRSLLKNGLKNLAIIDVANGDTVATELSKEFPGRKILFRTVNVAKRDEIDKIFFEIKKFFNGFDILVNCAGIYNDNDFQLTFDVNVVSIFIIFSRNI